MKRRACLGDRAGQCMCGAGPLPDQGWGSRLDPLSGQRNPRGSREGPGRIAYRGQTLAQLLPG